MVEAEEIYKPLGLSFDEQVEAKRKFDEAVGECEDVGEVIQNLGLTGEQALLAFLVGAEVAKARITGNALGTFDKVVGDYLPKGLKDKIFGGGDL